MTDLPTGDPILIPCEGTDCPTHKPDSFVGMCAMCGQAVLITEDGRAKPHVRDDIIARLKRGDFG